MSTEPGSNVDSTHQNIEQLVKRIEALQSEEELTQRALMKHEETRNETCQGTYETTTGFDGTTDHSTDYTAPCCSWETSGRKDGTSDLMSYDSYYTGDAGDPGAPALSDAFNRASKAEDTPFMSVDDLNTKDHVKTSLGNIQYKDQECLFKRNGGDAHSEQLIGQIHRLAAERAELFKTLMNIYANVQRDVSETRSDLVDQLTVVGVVEQELGNARENLDALAGAKNNNNRMSQINTYYGKRYNAHTGVMKMIIMICVPLLILAILGKKGYIGDNFTRPLALIVIIVGGYFLLSRVWDLWRRDNMNYDEYNWDFNPNNVKPTVYQYDKQQFDKGHGGRNIDSDLHALASDLGVECIGPNCCGKGMVYDHKANKCVDKKAHHTGDHAAHHARASADAQKQAEAFEVMAPISSTSYIAPPGCNSIQTTVRAYGSDDEEQYARV